MKNLGLVLAGVILGSGCGGSSATLHLYDAPPAGVTGVTVTIASMDLHVDDKSKTRSEAADNGAIDHDGKWQTLEVGEQIDLLQHQGEAAAATLGELDLPEGKITQLRLTLGDVNTVTFEDGSECELSVPTRQVKINHVFKAFGAKGDEHFDVFVHFDLEGALTDNGECFTLAPKIDLAKVKRDGADEPL